MRRFVFPLQVLVVLLIAGAPAPPHALSQQSDRVFVGRGRVARKHTRTDREPVKTPVSREELERPIPEQTLREILPLEQQCHDEINKLRVSRGLVALDFNDRLLDVARYHSRRMAEERFFSHTDPEGRNVQHRVADSGIRWRVVGENLAYSQGYVNPVAASISGWMSSPGHRRNILDPDYRQTAIGVWISSSGTVYFTEIFLR